MIRFGIIWIKNLISDLRRLGFKKSLRKTCWLFLKLKIFVSNIQHVLGLKNDGVRFLEFTNFSVDLKITVDCNYLLPHFNYNFEIVRREFEESLFVSIFPKKQTKNKQTLELML